MCRDASAVYRHFPYALDHLTGQLTLDKNMVAVNLRTVKDAQPLSLTGTIENPGVDAVVKLDINAAAIPIDDALKARCRRMSARLSSNLTPVASSRPMPR